MQNRDKTHQSQVSVVIPVHNGDRFLDEAIMSIRDQTLQDIEIILVENGSSDLSMAILQRYASEDPRIRVIEMQGVGSALAMNEGIKAASSPLVARMDQDDVATPSRLERQLAFLNEHPTVKVVGTFGEYISETGRVVGQARIGPISAEECKQLRRERKLTYLLSPSAMFSRDVVLRLGGFREEYFPADDVDLWSRVADEHLVLVLPEVLQRYRVHGAATSTQRFREHMRKTRWARENTERRRTGQDEMSWSEFVRVDGTLTPFGQLNRFRREQSQYYYRRGGGLLAAGRPEGLLFAGLSMLLNPIEALQRFSKQKVLHTIRSRRSECESHA